MGLALGAVLTAAAMAGAMAVVAPMGDPGGWWGYCERGHPVAGWAVGIDLPDGNPGAEQDAVIRAHYARCDDEARADRFRFGGSGSE